MNLDEMKDKWMEHDRKLEENIRLSRQLLSELHLQPARSRVRWMLAFTAVHTAAWLACVIALGNFIYEHAATPRFALAAVALDLYAIGCLIALIRQIALAAKIDYRQPVTAVQKQLETVRVLRIRTTQWAVLAGVVAWTPFLIVVFKAFFGLDVYQLFGTTWLAANLLFGLTLIPLAVWTSKKFGDRVAGSPLIQRIMKDLAGYNLNAASGFLAVLAEFERGTPASKS